MLELELKVLKKINKIIFNKRTILIIKIKTNINKQQYNFLITKMMTLIKLKV